MVRTYNISVMGTVRKNEGDLTLRSKQKTLNCITTV